MNRDYNIIYKEAGSTCVEHISGIHIDVNVAGNTASIDASYEDSGNPADVSEEMAIHAVNLAGHQVAAIERLGWTEMGSEHSSWGYFRAELA